MESSGPESKPYLWKSNSVKDDSAPILDDEENSGESYGTVSFEHACIPLGMFMFYQRTKKKSVPTTIIEWSAKPN